MMAANFNHDDRITGNEQAAVIKATVCAITARDQTGKTGIAATMLQNGCIISEAENEVHLQSDPTRHAGWSRSTAQRRCDRWRQRDVSPVGARHSCRGAAVCVAFGACEPAVLAVNGIPSSSPMPRPSAL